MLAKGQTKIVGLRTKKSFKGSDSLVLKVRLVNFATKESGLGRGGVKKKKKKKKKAEEEEERMG